MSSDETTRGMPGPSTAGQSSLTVAPECFSQLIQAIESSQARMEEKFARFQSEVRQGQEEAATKALKRARFEKPYSFRRKGNEAQALFNAKVDETLAQAESDAASVAGPSAAPALQRVVEALRKGRALIDERQKLIRLADRSEHGWGMVDEYTADDLAEDSEDEKRIEKAERAAERKAGKKRKRRTADAYHQPGCVGVNRAAP